MLLRKMIGTTAWLLATGASGAIVIRAMGTQEPILSAIGILGLIMATTGVYLAMDARRDRAIIATVLAFGMWVIGEAFLIPSEYNFWSSTVTARAEREIDYQRQADGRRLILDKAAKKLADETPARPVGQIQADINAALAKTYGRRTLAGLTNNCTDLSSPALKFCRDVFALQKELAAAEDRNTTSSLVWQANSQLGVDTSQAHGAHDLAANVSDLTGIKAAHIAVGLTLLTMVVLIYARAVSLYLGWRQPKTARKTKAASVTETAIAEAKEDQFRRVPKLIPAPVTAPAPEPAPVTAEAKEKPADVTGAATPDEAANDNAAGVTATPDETEEPAPVTAKRGRKKKRTDWTNIAAYSSVPKIHLSELEVDYETAAIDAVIDEGLTGQTYLAPGTGRKRANALLKRKGVKKLISQEKFDKRLRERCKVLGVRVDSLVGRQLRFTREVSPSKKENTRLGNSAQFSIPA